MENLKILLVDDEKDLCEILQFNLQKEGFQADYCLSSEQALKRDLDLYDFFILDVMMGEISGFELARIIRRNSSLNRKPILFLSAKETEKDRLTGFDAGADDYVAKPFSIKEIIARIKVIQNRTGPERQDYQILQYNELKMIPALKQAILYNKDIHLTKTEYELLRLLLGNQGRIFSREEILNRIWKNDTLVNDRTVDVNIRRIRKKIGEYRSIIKTKSGYGYYITPENRENIN
jgi:two-component system phosphate regulon response regulator PhoB